MSQAITADAVPARSDAESLPARDKFIIGFLVFCMLVAPLELYWIIFRAEVAGRTDVMARLLSIYWPADRTYRDGILDNAQAFTLSLESVNACFSQFLNVALVWAILKRKQWRHSLQLTLSTYTFYGTFLYFYVAHLSGYTVMAQHTTGNFLLFYITNLPWFFGYAYMMYDSIVAINKRFRGAAA
jgi:hypothetical protein